MNLTQNQDSPTLKKLKNLERRIIYNQRIAAVNIIDELPKRTLLLHRVSDSKKETPEDEVGDVSLLQLAATYLDKTVLQDEKDEKKKTVKNAKTAVKGEEAETEQETEDDNDKASVVKKLLRKCRSLLDVKRKDCYKGQTVLHTLIAKGHLDLVQWLLEEHKIQLERLKDMAVGSNFDGTVLMGQLPLSIAALTFSQPMVDLLLEHNANIQERNGLGDTVFHSLIRFCSYYPGKEDEVIDMMHLLHIRLKKKWGEQALDMRSVWLTENKKGLTPLKMAAKLMQPKLFDFILTLKGVYSTLDLKDGLFDFLKYDVTEIDPAASRKATIIAYNKEKTSNIKAQSNAPQSAKAGMKKMPKMRKPVSILEIVNKAKDKNVQKAFEILKHFVVKPVIKRKWKKYRPWFFVYALVHVLMMILLTIYAIYKSRLHVGLYTPGQEKVEDGFALGTSIIVAVWSVANLLWEFVRIFRGEPFLLLVAHSSGAFRCLTIICTVSFLIDCLWYWSKGPNEPYLLILGLLAGWWFSTFFLRPIKAFSFFTVMLHRVLIGDVFRFGTVLLTLYVAFSASMYITFMSSSPAPPTEFATIWNTCLTMFRLMLGLSEVDVLYEAPQPWLAVLLFVLYVVLTFVLMLTSLFALMSNTASLISQNKDCQRDMQTLSVISYLEASIPEQWIHIAGEEQSWHRLDSMNKQSLCEPRFTLKIFSVRGHETFDEHDDDPMHDLLYTVRYQDEQESKCVTRGIKKRVKTQGLGDTATSLNSTTQSNISATEHKMTQTHRLLRQASALLPGTRSKKRKSSSKIGPDSPVQLDVETIEPQPSAEAQRDTIE